MLKRPRKTSPITVCSYLDMTAQALGISTDQLEESIHGDPWYKFVRSLPKEQAREALKLEIKLAKRELGL